MRNTLTMVHIITLLFISFNLHANTNIYILNNTDKKINMFLNDFHEISTQYNNEIEPYQLSKVMNISRYSGLETDKKYNIFAFFGYEYAALNVDILGTVWGSEMSFNLIDPETTHVGLLYSDRNIHHYEKGNYEYYIKASYTGGYDDITVVVNDKNSSVESQENTIDIISYNTWMLNFIGQKMETRDSLIAKEVRNHDVVFMQEVFRSENEREIISTMGDYFNYTSDKLDGGGSNTYDGGVITFSKYPIVEQNQHVFDNCKGTDCAADKGVLYTKIVKDNQNYHLFNLHLGSWDTQQHRDVRILQLGEIFVFMQSLNLPDDEPIIIGGDFNINKHKFPLDYMQMLRILGVSDPELIGELIYSYDPLLNNFFTPSEEGRERFDYLLYVDNGAILDSNSQIKALRSFDQSIWGTWDLSDHFAINANFTIKHQE